MSAEVVGDLVGAAVAGSVREGDPKQFPLVVARRLATAAPMRSPMTFSVW